jgi:HEAT repeat protein
LSWLAWENEWDKWLDEGRHIPNIESRLSEMLTAGKDTAQRTLIIRALGDVGDWHSYNLLLELMQSEAEPISVRREAIAVVPGLALAHPDGTVAANLETMLLDILGNEGEDVGLRTDAAYGLGKLGRPEAVAALAKVALGAEAPSLRYAACCGLTSFGGQETVAVLGKVVSEAGEVDLRVGVCYFLASLGGPEAEAYLERAASDPSPAVSGAAGYWLAKLRSGEPLLPWGSSSSRGEGDKPSAR